MGRSPRRGSAAKASGEPDASTDRPDIIMQPERVLNTYDEASDFCAPMGRPFDVQSMIDIMMIRWVNESRDGMNLEFDLIGAEAPIANALRRVLLAEVPSMAIEKVYLYQNTSVIPDEVLCHRLGLLPIYVDARPFGMPLVPVIGVNEGDVDVDEEPAPDPTRELIFNLNVTCSKNDAAASDDTLDYKVKYLHGHVYSQDFVWLPCGEQTEQLGADPPRIVHEDILVAKLRPGQQIEASCHVVKGIGRDHVKFSPVATASYRLLPTIELKDEVTGADAELLKECFSEGVIELVPHASNGVRARVADARRDACSRNVFRHEQLADKVVMGLKKNHFIFSVESVGALKSRELVVEACNVLQEKARSLHKLLAEKLCVKTAR